MNGNVFKQRCLEKLTLTLAWGVLQSKGKDLNEAQSTVTFLYKHLINPKEVLALPEDTPVPALPPSSSSMASSPASVSLLAFHRPTQNLLVEHLSMGGV